MRKFFKAISVLMILVLCLTCTPFAMAEEPAEEKVSNIKPEPIGEFDYTVLQNFNGYNYDKFEKQWSYYAGYDKEYSDADILIAIKLFGEHGGNNLEEVDLYAKVIDKQGNNIKTVQSLSFLIDDTMYSINKMPTPDGTMAGCTFLYDSGYELVKALADGKEVSIKLSYYDGGSTILDLTYSDFADMQELCKNVVKYNIWDYYIQNFMLGVMEFASEFTIKK